MHVSHHLPPPPELNARAQTRKLPEDEDKHAFTHLTGLGSDKRRKGSKGQQQDQKDPEQAPQQPVTSGLLRARPGSGASKPAPFLAVTSVTQFWTELVMANKDDGVESSPAPVAPAAQQTGPSLLDLFSQAVK